MKNGKHEKFEYRNEGLGTKNERNLSNRPSELELANSELSKTIAAQGMVLLQNKDHALPIEKKGRIALYGGAAYGTVKGGSGSGAVNQREAVNIFEGFKRAGYEVVTADRLEKYGKKYDAVNADEMIRKRYGLLEAVPEALLDEAEVKEDAARAETGIYVVGRNSGEGADRKKEKGDYYLSDLEEHNLRCVAKAFKTCVLLLNVGGIIDTGFLEKIPEIRAVLLMHQAGQRGGDAVVEVLNGTVPPSGKLTDTWAAHYGDYPSSAVFAGNDGDPEHNAYTEGIFNGYRYFDSFAVKPVFEFGYGLSYTEFGFDPLDTELVYDGQKKGMGKYEIRTGIRVTNLGTTWRGKEVVQLYVSKPEGENGAFGKLDQAYQSLVGFAKTDWLEPGQTQTLFIGFPAAALASYSEKQEAYVMEKGRYLLRAGTSSRNTRVIAVLELNEDVITEQLKNVYTNSVGYEKAKDVVAIHPPKHTEERLPEQIKTLMLDEKKLALINGTVDGQAYSEDATAHVSFSTDQGYLNRNLGYVLYDGYTGTVYQEKEQVYTDEEGRLEDYRDATLADVYDGKISMEQFVSAMSVSKMTDIIMGGSKLQNAEGQSAGAKSENAEFADGTMIGAQGNSVSGSAGETAAIYINSDLIPNIVVADGPAGIRINPRMEAEDGKTYYQYCTAWPVGTLAAQTWDYDLIMKMGEGVGKEMSRYGITIWLAPGMNLHRNPLCGRNFEYYSEDPLLSGKMAAAITEGVQSVPGVGVCIKHFAANNQETARRTGTNYIDERTFRELYTRGFEIAVKEAQPMSIMTSYNRNNEIPAADDFALCTQLARREWGFQGVIMTDWGYAQSTPAISMHAGNDLIMPGKPVEEITVAGFRDRDPNWDEDDCYPRVVGIYSSDRTVLRYVETDWNDFVPDETADADTPGYVEYTKTVDTPVFEQAFREKTVMRNGVNVLERSVPLAEVIRKQKGVRYESDPGTGKTTVYFKGHYKYSRISLGDVQKSTANILKVVMASSNFADVYNAYQEYIGSDRRIRARSWTNESYRDRLLTFQHFEKGPVK